MKKQTGFSSLLIASLLFLPLLAQADSSVYSRDEQEKPSQKPAYEKVNEQLSEKERKSREKKVDAHEKAKKKAEKSGKGKLNY